LFDMALSLCNPDERVLPNEKIQELKNYIPWN
jgi:hypothetical protein